MENKKKKVKYVFELPALNSEEKTSGHRKVSPMELFFDLAFILAIGTISKLFLQEDYVYLIDGIILYFYFILSWSNITLYNIYFWSENGSYFIRFFLILIMIPIILISSIHSITPQSINFLIINLIILKVSVAFIWYITLDKNKRVQNKYLKSIMNKYLLVRMGSIFLLIFSYYIDKKYLTSILLFTMIYEFVLQRLFTANYKKKIKEKLPFLNLELLKERTLLLIVLIFGEGIIIISELFSFEHYNLSIILLIIIYIQIALFFLKIYYDFNLIKFEKGYEDVYIMDIYVGTFSFLLLFTIFKAIGENALFGESVTLYQHLVLLALLLFFSIHHLINNIGYYMGRKVLFSYNREIYFSKIDTISNIIMIIISLITLVISNPVTLLLVTFLYYVVHLVPTFFDYDRWKNENAKVIKDKSYSEHNTVH